MRRQARERSTTERPLGAIHTERPAGRRPHGLDLLWPWLLMGLLLLGCSAADLVQRSRVTPTPEPIAVLVPTFTPTPDQRLPVIIVTPPADGKPGLTLVPPGLDPGATPAPPAPSAPAEEPAAGQPPSVPGPMPATATPSPSPTASPSPTPTPYVLVESGLVALRTGPGVEYPQVTQLGPGIPVAIIGRTWYEICCISGLTLWVAASHVAVRNDVSQVAIGSAGPPPTATPTFTPTATDTPTATPTPTPYPFEKSIGPQFFPTSNEFLTIWAKIFAGPNDQRADPLTGYRLRVFFEGFERPNASGMEFSVDTFQRAGPPGDGKNTVQYNFKYEYYPPDPQIAGASSGTTRLQLLGTGTWTVYVTDGSGAQLSEVVTFTTAPDNPNREIYIGWTRVR